MTQDSEDIQLEELQRFISESKREGVNIVVVGETGAGKSTLVNGLIGENTMKRAKVCRSARSVTTTVEEFQIKKGDVQVKVFDTPGLCDPRVENSAVFQQIAVKTGKKIDLLVFCHDMRIKVKESDVEAIGCIATAFSRSCDADGNSWDNVLYVLTFANKVESDLKEEERDGPSGQEEEVEALAVSNVAQKFKKSLQDYKQTLQEYTKDVITKKGLPDAETMANKIPVIPAGYRKPSLSDCKDWLTHLWKGALTRVKFTAVPAFIDATALSRLQPEGVGPDNSMKEPAQRNLDDKELRESLTQTSRKSLALGAAILILSTTAGAIVGSVFGPGGAAAGASIGWSIGASGLKLAGGTVGVGVVVSYKKYRDYQRKKKE